LFPCVKETGPVIALVKPQLEAGSHALNKKGVVKDKAVFRTVLEHIQTAAREQGRGVADCILSPVRGGDGNIEFLVLLQTGAAIFEFEPLIRMVSM